MTDGMASPDPACHNGVLPPRSEAEALCILSSRMLVLAGVGVLGSAETSSCGAEELSPSYAIIMPAGRRKIHCPCRPEPMSVLAGLDTGYTGLHRQLGAGQSFASASHYIGTCLCTFVTTVVVKQLHKLKSSTSANEQCPTMTCF